MATLLCAGAAGEVTGSRHLLTINGKRILLDCGLCQGHRKDADAKNRKFLFEPRGVDAVILSHAHLDHAGNLPRLSAQGFKGTIFATPATADLTQIMLLDSAHIQEKDAEFFNKKNPKTPIVPLYTTLEAQACQKQFRGVPYDTPFEPVPGVTAVLQEAGHILGSAQITLQWQENGVKRSLRFTGDLGRKDMPLLNSPHLGGGIDTLVMESTYGDRLHEHEGDGAEALAKVLEEGVRTGGKIIIPAFSVGRTQELLYHIETLHQVGKLPKIPIWIDSPLAQRATEVFERHKADMDPAFQAIDRRGDPFRSSMVRFTASPEESMALNRLPGPMAILSASGMCEAGRVLHHLRNNLGDAKNRVVIVGYQAEGTLGRRLADGQKRVKIYGQEFDVAAKVLVLHEYSAHADREDLVDYVEHCKPLRPRVVLVHGEPQAQSALADELRSLLRVQVDVPRLAETLEL